MYQQPVNLGKPQNFNSTPLGIINRQNGYQNRAQITKPSYPNPPVSYPPHGYINHLRPLIGGWNSAQRNPNPFIPTNNVQYGNQDKPYIDNVYQSVPSVQQNVPLNHHPYPQNQYFQNVSNSCNGKQVPVNSSNFSQSMYSSNMFMKDQQNPIQHHQSSNISYSMHNHNKNPPHDRPVQNPISNYQQDIVQNKQKSIVQGWHHQEISRPRKRYPSHKDQTINGQQHQQLISEHNENYAAFIDTSTTQRPSGNNGQSSFVNRGEAQGMWYCPNQVTEASSSNSLQIENVLSIPLSSFSKLPSETSCPEKDSSESLSATQAGLKQEKNFNKSECIKVNSESIKSPPLISNESGQKMLISLLLNFKSDASSSCTNVESKKMESKQIEGSEVQAHQVLNVESAQSTISSGSNTSPSKRSSSLDEKSREAAFRDLKGLYRQDQSSSVSLQENIFRKPKEKKRHNSSDKSPSSRICPSPDSTFLPENSRFAAQSFLSPPHTTDMDDLMHLSPRSDTTVAYCDGRRIDELDATDKSPPSSLKRGLGEVEDSIRKRQRLFGYGTECDSTFELFSESLESNNIDRMTPSKQTMLCSGTGCSSIRNTNIRYCILDGRKFFVWKDFKCVFEKYKDLSEENLSSAQLCSEAEAKILSLEFSKLPAVLEGDKLYSFKVIPECFEENVSVNSEDSTENVPREIFNKKTTTCNDSSNLNVLLRTSSVDVNKTTTGCKEMIKTSGSAKLDLKAELEKITTMSGDVVKSLLLNLMEECVKLKEENSQLQQNLQTQLSQNKSLQEILKKTASLLKN